MSENILQEIIFCEEEGVCKTLDGRVVNPTVKSPLIVFQTDDALGGLDEPFFNRVEDEKEYLKQMEERKDIIVKTELRNLTKYYGIRKEEVNAYMLCRQVVPFRVTLSYPNGHMNQGTNAAGIMFYHIEEPAP